MMLRVPSLDHAGDVAGMAATQEREGRSKTLGQLAGLTSGTQVIALVAAESLVLDEEDRGGPVTV
jgi:hypothetical protein